MKNESKPQPVTLHWPAASATTTAASAPTDTIDLSQSIFREQLAKRIKADIDAYCVEAFDDGHRKHLGASLIGRECSRYLWYVFRWVKHVQSSGRQHRLFNRGHLEEARFISYLEGIGATVQWCDTTQPKNADGEHPQIRIEDCGGHFGGSLDAEVTLPEKYGVGTLVFINEYKTHNAKSFDKLTKEYVQATKYEHFCQMSIYGRKRGHKYGLYMAVNKNDDELHIEVVPLDWALADRLLDKANRIINSPTPPQRISETITYKQCAYCDMNDVCHKAREYEKNCRSCRFAQPVANKQWHCHAHNGVIPAEFIPSGCGQWSAAV